MDERRHTQKHHSKISESLGINYKDSTRFQEKKVTYNGSRKQNVLKASQQLPWKLLNIIVHLQNSDKKVISKLELNVQAIIKEDQKIYLSNTLSQGGIQGMLHQNDRVKKEKEKDIGNK